MNHKQASFICRRLIRATLNLTPVALYTQCDKLAIVVSQLLITLATVDKFSSQSKIHGKVPRESTFILKIPEFT